MLTSPEILVPMDFSPCSVNALRVAVGMAAPEGDLTLLHVIDRGVCRRSGRGWIGYAPRTFDNVSRNRLKLTSLHVLEGLDAGQVNIEKMIVVGLPFVEILKIARDLDLPMIVMGIRGQSTPAEELLFGSTAEKVLRGTRVPVLCVPF